MYELDSNLIDYSGSLSNYFKSYIEIDQNFNENNFVFYKENIKENLNSLKENNVKIVNKIIP